MDEKEKKEEVYTPAAARLDNRLKLYEVEEKKKYVKEWRTKELETSQQRVEVEKIEALKRLLESEQMDADNTVLASEPKYECCFTQAERDIIKKKIFEIIKRL